MRVALIVHVIEDPSVDRLETIAKVGNGPADDDRHGIVQIGRPHFIFYRDGRAVVLWGLCWNIALVFRGFGSVAHVSPPFFAARYILLSQLYQRADTGCNGGYRPLLAAPIDR